MESFCDLPSDIVERIMLWVPADSLLQSKSVNKFWYSHISTFINNPEFVAKHLLITKNQSSLTLLFYLRNFLRVHNRLITYPLSTIIYDDDDEEEDDDGVIVTEGLSVPRRSKPWDKFMHCDGLLLLAKIDHQIPKGKPNQPMVLCNPALKEFMILPKLNNARIDCYTAIGFELDSKNNQYKCVAIWYHCGQCQAEAYTVGSDSWREIGMSQDIMDAIVGFELTNCLCLEGVCYWLVDKGAETECEWILSFDMSDEQFCTIHLPDFGALGVEDWASTRYVISLAVWNDSLVICLTLRLDGNIIFIFTMDEAAAGSWSKYGQVGPLEKKIKFFLPIWKNDEILMKVYDDDDWRAQKLVSCNIHTQKLRCVDPDLPIEAFEFNGCLYVKSLISIRGR
ncbi:probable F-box protein At3g22720 isoform X2 [Humulus lupulus]|nr:probable F-box protein At3g22720 isoform X2 [Humulus lupulus]